jgi:serine/threonine-protein kinase
MTDITNLAGQIIGQYELRELLGRGNLTAVYRAYQHAKRREVAVKVMHEDLTIATGYLERFSTGARAAASLDHPHIVPFYDYGTQTGLSYVVTRHLTGGTLAERIRHAASQNLPRASLSEIAEFLSQIASALDYAHLKGVYHDGIRPENILFDNRGTAYVADFGIAHLLRQMSPVRDGLAYMAPERWRDNRATAAVDQYGLAMIAYQLVAGRLPFEGVNEQQLMYEHLNEPPPALAGTRPELPEAVSLVLERALSKDPSARFRSMTAFAQTFKSAIEGVRGEPTGFFVFKLPKRERQPISPPAINVMQPVSKLDETVPSVPVQNEVPTAQSEQVLVERPTAPSEPVLIEGQTVPSAPVQMPEPEEDRDEVSGISAVTRPSRKRLDPTPAASSPVAPNPAEAKPPLERSGRRRASRREVVLGLMAIAVITLVMIAVKMVRGDLRSEDAAGVLTQPAANPPTRQPAIVILPTDNPTQAPASETSEVTIAAEMVASNAVEFRTSADAGLTGIVWDFGDGSTAAEASPVHTYTVPGIYTVRMTATGPDGNEVVTTAEVTVIEGCILTPQQGTVQIYAAPVSIHVITTLGTIPEGTQLFTAESRRGQDGFIWYRVTHNGTAGWAHSSAMRAVSGKCP